MGFVYKAGNKESLKNIMSSFKNNPEYITKLGENAYNFGLNNTINSFAQQLNLILKNL